MYNFTGRGAVDIMHRNIFCCVIGSWCCSISDNGNFWAANFPLPSLKLLLWVLLRGRLLQQGWKADMLCYAEEAAEAHSDLHMLLHLSILLIFTLSSSWLQRITHYAEKQSSNFCVVLSNPHQLFAGDYEGRWWGVKCHWASASHSSTSIVS